MAMIIIAKRIEERKKTKVFFLKLVSEGDELCRKLHHQMVEFYSAGKERAHFMVLNQLPRYSRSSLNKALSRFEENMQKYLNRLRDSRLLKKDEGISDYFKSMSEVEKGMGEINEFLFSKPKRTRKPRAKKIVITEEI